MPRWKSSAIRIAKELCYPAEIIDKLITADTKETISRILITARETVIKYDNIQKANEYVFTPHCSGVVRYTA